jgi:hypothetical protein
MLSNALSYVCDHVIVCAMPREAFDMGIDMSAGTNCDFLPAAMILFIGSLPLLVDAIDDTISNGITVEPY